MKRDDTISAILDTEVQRALVKQQTGELELDDIRKIDLIVRIGSKTASDPDSEVKEISPDDLIKAVRSARKHPNKKF